MKYSATEIAQRYDSFAPWYDFMEVFNALLIGRYRKRLLRNVRGNVLEVGIGTGANLKYYLSQCNVIGIDMSSKMLMKAQEKASRLGMKIRLQKGNVEKLPFKSKSFDYVVDTLGLCTYPHPHTALREMKRVCKKSGKIILLEHGISNIAFIRNLQQRREAPHYRKIGCSLLLNHAELVNKAGLKIETFERKFFGIFYLIKARL